MNNQQKSKKQANVFVTLLVILMTVAVAVAIAGAVAKNVKSPDKRGEREGTSDSQKDTSPLRENMVHDAEDEVTAPKKEEEKPKETEPVTESTVETTAPEESKEDAFTEEKLPTFAMPISGEVQKEYSMDVPVFSLTMEDFRTHNGIDIFAEVGSEVKASADGVISEIWDDAMMGKSVSVSHPGNAVTVYKNLGEELPEGIEKGAEVHAGDVIGTVGDTALEEIAEESHLHLEMTVNGIYVNPADYLK